MRQKSNTVKKSDAHEIFEKTNDYTNINISGFTECHKDNSTGAKHKSKTQLKL